MSNGMTRNSFARTAWWRIDHHLQSFEQNRVLRRDSECLLKLSHHGLKDIGLTRDYIEQVLSKPLD